MPKITIKNLNTEINRRIKLIKTATSVVDIGQQQGAVFDQGSFIGICLAPFDEPSISCEGATSSVYGAYTMPESMTSEEFFAWYNGVDPTILYINGDETSYDYFFENLVEDSPVDIPVPTEIIPEGYKVDFNIPFLWKNKLNENIRIEEKVNNSDVIKIIYWGNPTANGSQVCLAAKSEVIPIGCAGAIPIADTGGIWGTSVLMLVNGIGYDGIRSIPDILEFDNQGLETHWKFKNISDDFLKVQINTGAENISEGDGGWAENTNPTLEVNFETGQVNFCLSPAGACEPTEFTMIENDSFVGGSARLDYVVNAPDHGVENVSKRFSMTDIQQGTYLSEIVRQVISQIKEDYPFIAIREGTGTQTANFDFWTYRSTVNGSFLLAGVEGVLSKDPITIKFVKTGFIDDLFALIFPDGLTEYSAHSCGSQELVGI